MALVREQIEVSRRSEPASDVYPSTKANNDPNDKARIAAGRFGFRLIYSSR